MAERFSDTLTYVISVALAAGVITFAAYKVVKLNGMEDPPANMGLNFPPPKRKVIIEEGGADPIATQSLGPRQAARPPLHTRPTPDGGLLSYELLTVVDGVAFVAVGSDDGKTLVPVTVGTRMPGGLEIDAIERRDGRWTVTAGTLKLEQTPLPPQ